MKRLLSTILVVVMLFGMLATGVFGASATETTYRGTAFTAGVNQNINFTQGSYDILTFDYILTTEGQIAIAIRSPGDVPYYGLYYFTADGAKSNYPGISCEKLDDGYIRVTCLLDGLFTTNSNNNRLNAPAVINKINIYRTSTASGYIDNVQVYDDPAMEGEHGAITTAGTTFRFPFDLADYDYVSFEYKLTSNLDKNGYICVRIPSAGDVPYYGLFYFYATGGSYDGVTCEPMENGYYKVTIETDKVHRISNKDNNRAAVPESIKAVDIHQYSTADARIDNVKAYNEEVIRGTTTTAGVKSRFAFTEGAYETISMDYKLTSEGIINVILRSPGDVPYYGIYSFNADGGNYEGITFEKLDDGYIRAVFDVAKLNKTNNANNRDNAPATLSAVDIYHTSTANALVDRVIAKLPVEPHGDALANDYIITTTPGSYAEVSVDYQVTNDGQFAIVLTDAAGENYYGKYFFNASGEAQDYAGVACTARDDGYLKITFDIAALALNSGVAPAQIGAIKIVDNTAEGYVDNAQFKKSAVPTGIRVGILSDVHIHATNPLQAQRFENALNALKLRGVDAVLIAGDLQEHTGGDGAQEAIEQFAEIWFKVFPNNTNDLTGEHVEPIFIYGNHDQTLVADQYWPESLGSYQDAFIKEVNGYYFVGANFWQEAAASNLIHLAEQDSNGYPFFYVQHCPVYGTLYDSENQHYGTAQTVLYDLWDASNAVVFSGHTHLPATDERSIWQSESKSEADFTAVMLPSINYGYLGDVNLGTTTYTLCQQGMYMVVDGSDVSITRLSFAEGETGLEIGEDWSFDAGDPEDKPYDYETRAKAASKPVFAANAAIGVDYLGQDRVTFTFPAATVTAPEGFSDQIQLYNVELINKATGEVVKSQYKLTDYMYDDKAERFEGPYTMTMMGLEANTQYIIKVYAREFYQVDSEPLTLEIDTTNGAAAVNRGTATTAGKTTNISFTAGAYDYVEFDYKPTTEGTVSVIIRSPGAVPYYGGYTFDAAGTDIKYDGVTTEVMEDGYIHVTMKLSELTRTNGADNRNNVPATINSIDIYQWSKADAYVDNVKAYKEEVIRGTATTAGTTKRFSYPLDKYDVIVFDYKLTSNQDKNGYIAVRLPSSGDVPYYGLFHLYNNGGNYEGVTCEQLDDGYIRVTIDLNKVNRTNSADNRNNVPDAIKAVDIHYYSTANAYIDNIHAYKAVVTAPTATKEGYTTYTCSICGDSYVADVVPAIGIGELKFSGGTVALYSDLSVFFKANATLFVEDAYTNPYVVFTVGNATMTVTDYTVENGKYSFACHHLSPSQIGDTITATLYATLNGEQKSYTMEYSVAQYCYNQLGKVDDAKLKTLLVDLLNYGAAAQTYAWYKDKTLCNAALTAEQKAYGTATVPAVTTVLNTKYVEIDNAKVTWTAGGLVLDNGITVRMRFAAESVDGLTVKVEAAGNTWIIDEFEVSEKAGQYYVYFSGLSARQMREHMKVTVYEGDTVVSNTLLYSIESYIYAKQNDSNANLAALVKAMICYGDSAAAYLNN